MNEEQNDVLEFQLKITGESAEHLKQLAQEQEVSLEVCLYQMLSFDLAGEWDNITITPITPLFE